MPDLYSKKHRYGVKTYKGIFSKEEFEHVFDVCDNFVEFNIDVGNDTSIVFFGDDNLFPFYHVDSSKIVTVSMKSHYLVQPRHGVDNGIVDTVDKHLIVINFFDWYKNIVVWSYDELVNALNKYSEILTDAKQSPITEKARIISSIGKSGYVFVSINDKKLRQGVDYLLSSGKIISFKALGFDFKNADEFFTSTEIDYGITLMTDRWGYLVISNQLIPPDKSWKTVHKTDQLFVCVCNNPKFGFDCSCEWERENPGEKSWLCDWHGIYSASKPKCSNCE